MKSPKIPAKPLLIPSASGLLAAGVLTFLPIATAPAQSNDQLGPDLQSAFERQVEQLGSLLPNDPETQEQFRKSLEEMRKAMEADATDPSKAGQPRTFEFRWQSDGSDPGAGGTLPTPNLGGMRSEFERLGGLFGEDLFDRFFGGGSDFGRGPRLFPDRFGSPFDAHGLDPFNGMSPFDIRPGIESIPEHSKNHPDELRKFAPVVENARKSTVRVLSGGRQIAMGTVIAEDGFALTKLSELGTTPRLFEVQLADGRSVAARVVRGIPEHDLALLKLEADNLTPAVFVDKPLPLGSFLVAPDLDEIPAAYGVLSVEARTLSAKEKGFLGIQMQPSPEGVAVAGVTPGSAAAAAGLERGDIITQFDGKDVASMPQLMREVATREPDQIVQLQFVRNGRDKTTSARLRSRAELAKIGLNPNFDKSAYDPTHHMGASLNRQRGGYPSAMQHDLPLSSNQMGGPVVDLDGDIIGINIARAGRVNTYALPASELAKVIESLDLDTDRNGDPDAPVETAKNNKALREDVERAEEILEKAREALRVAEESARKARKALENSEQ